MNQPIIVVISTYKHTDKESENKNVHGNSTPNEGGINNISSNAATSTQMKIKNLLKIPQSELLQVSILTKIIFLNYTILIK